MSVMKKEKGGKKGGRGKKRRKKREGGGGKGRGSKNPIKTNLRNTEKTSKAGTIVSCTI